MSLLSFLYQKFQYLSFDSNNTFYNFSAKFKYQKVIEVTKVTFCYQEGALVMRSGYFEVFPTTEVGMCPPGSTTDFNAFQLYLSTSTFTLPLYCNNRSFISQSTGCPETEERIPTEFYSFPGFNTHDANLTSLSKVGGYICISPRLLLDSPVFCRSDERGKAEATQQDFLNFVISHENNILHSF